VIALALVGCGLYLSSDDVDARLDADGDGFLATTFGGDDCDDTAAWVHPGAEDAWYDGVDANCDGADDFDQDGDGLASRASGGLDCDDTRQAVRADLLVYLPDCDGDGAPTDAPVEGCEPPPGPVDACGGTEPTAWVVDRPGLLFDCDDADVAVSPFQTDVPYDGVDGDCDGGDDFDADGDGHVALAYAAPGTPGDCDDADPFRHPGANEVWYDGVDQDCDGADDFDRDGDGIVVALDCDDTVPSVFPGATEVWYDGVDQDCDGADDFDRDGDGRRHPSAGGVTAPDCDDDDPATFPGAPDPWYDGVDQDCGGNDDFDRDGDGAPLDVDCDDLDPTVRPGLDDIPYDGVDTACNGDADEYDADGDGFVPAVFLDLAPVGTPADPDCDDTDAATYPGAPGEVPYDGIDTDCDGRNDYDADGDGVVAAGYLGVGGGTAVALGDCDDTDPTVSPNAGEVCGDGVDQDCRGDDDYDCDRDGYVADAVSALSDLPAGDCDDGDPLVNPGAEDPPYDGVDSACDGDLREYDADGDGFASVGSPGAQPTDCNDLDADISPGTTERPYNGLDDDCSAATPDDDLDGDGFRSVHRGGLDCDDTPDPFPDDALPTGASVYPGAPEVHYDGVDQNCIPLDEYDADGDGFVASGTGGADRFTAGLGVGDCDDTDPTIHPGAVDPLYDGISHTCRSDFDKDGDGYLAIGFDGLVAMDPTSAGLLEGDCDDARADVHPGRGEVWYDGVDGNCDGANDYDRDGDGFAVDLLQATTQPDMVDACDDDPERFLGDLTFHPDGELPIVFPAGEERPVRLRDIGAWLCDGGTVELVGAHTVASPAVFARSATVVGGVGASVDAVSIRPFEATGERFELSALTVRGGVGADGGCLRAAVDELVVDDVRFEDCAGSAAGGAVAWLDGPAASPGDATFHDVVVRDAVARFGGGVAVVRSQGGTVDLTRFSSLGGVAYDRGGALFLDGPFDALLTDVTVEGAEADDAAGVYAKDVRLGVHGLVVQGVRSPARATGTALVAVGLADGSTLQDVDVVAGTTYGVGEAAMVHVASSTSVALTRVALRGGNAPVGLRHTGPLQALDVVVHEVRADVGIEVRGTGSMDRVQVVGVGPSTLGDAGMVLEAAAPLLVRRTSVVDNRTFHALRASGSGVTVEDSVLGSAFVGVGPALDGLAPGDNLVVDSTTVGVFAVEPRPADDVRLTAGQPPTLGYFGILP
jgi:hypothetical protein